MDMARVNLRVTGKVQGVSFRQSTLQQAQRLALCGWVQNLADGSVEIEAEGERSAVEVLVGWARVGPATARVEGVRVQPLAPTGTERTFRVLPG